jgi:hypothetical protein
MAKILSLSFYRDYWILNLMNNSLSLNEDKTASNTVSKVLSIVDQMIANGDMVDSHDSEMEQNNKIIQSRIETDSNLNHHNGFSNEQLESNHPNPESNNLDKKINLEFSPSTTKKANIISTGTSFAQPTDSNTTSDKLATNRENDSKSPLMLPNSTEFKAACDPRQQKHIKLNQIRVKMLRVLNRLGNTQGNISQQALLRLETIEHGIPSLKKFRHQQSLEKRTVSANKLAQEEAETLEKNNCRETILEITVLCLGIISTGKTLTIHNIVGFESESTPISATSSIKIVRGKAYGVQWTFIDTPGLYPSYCAKNYNERVLRKIKKLITSYKPDICMYFDRLDYARRGNADKCVFTSVSEILGVSYLTNFMIILTHAGNSYIKGALGQLGFEKFCEQRQRMINQQIIEVSKESRIRAMFYPVENHHTCIEERSHLHLLPNGNPWRPNVINFLVVYKSLQEADKLTKLQNKSNKSNRLQLWSLLGYAPQRNIQNMLDKMMYPLETLECLDEDERSIKYESEINKMEHDSIAKKEASIRRKKEIGRRIIQKNEDNRRAKNGICADTGETAIEHALIPLTFDSTNAIAHRYRLLKPKKWYSPYRILQPQQNQSLYIMDHDDGISGVRLLLEDLMIRKPGNFVGGLPSYIRAGVVKDKQNSDLKIETGFTTGLDVLPVSVGSLETTYLNAHISCDRLNDQTGSAGTNYTVRIESLTNSSFLAQNKLIFGLLMSSEYPVKLNGPWTRGAKIEDRINFGENCEASVSLGVCNARSPGGTNQDARNLIMTIRRKIHKNSILSANASMSWFRRDSNLVFTVEHQKNVSLGTILNTEVIYDLRGKGKILLKTSSSDHTEISLFFLLPIIGAFWNSIKSVRSGIKKEEFF